MHIHNTMCFKMIYSPANDENIPRFVSWSISAFGAGQLSDVTIVDVWS